MNAVLHVVSDRQRTRLPLHESLLQSVEGGADVIQWREKKAPAAQSYQECSAFLQAMADAGQQAALFVNDRLDVAMAVGALGVHLAAKSLPVAVARRVADRAQWPGLIGCSVHSFEAAVAAAQAGADYITFGHIFASESHPGLPPRGVGELRRIVEAVSIPVIAIGGIDHTNVDVVLATGCSGVAVIGAVIGHPNPRQAARQLKQAMARSPVQPKHPFPLLNRTPATTIPEGGDEHGQRI
ncbi:MAG: thiamine phosphate synthase [Alicyclobacillus herbarius]|uniref:thiamine phosphate synthase n=1 Tax=Alicyclobacillus herbarius TaxID=122960 RepID=UPI0006873006|nr:thiamine phosphate synthase [Alicyclobacillus herbarius]MCL6632678.1 thiamine phosphate synthase [Alicyclobacillus herbarius]